MRREEAGVTLTETLIALLVISLALASVLSAGTLLAHAQRRNTFDKRREVAVEQVKRELVAALAPRQPVIGAQLKGFGPGFNYVCSKPQEPPAYCHYALRESAIEGSHLVYAGGGGIHDRWPPASASPHPEQPRLEAVILRDNSDKTLAVVRLDVEQTGDCQFDMISRVCRETAPATKVAP